MRYFSKTCACGPLLCFRKLCKFGCSAVMFTVEDNTNNSMPDLFGSFGTPIGENTWPAFRSFLRRVHRPISRNGTLQSVARLKPKKWTCSIKIRCPSLSIPFPSLPFSSLPFPSLPFRLLLLSYPLFFGIIEILLRQSGPLEFTILL